MKIGIITIVGNNYGNRLQNYALQSYLKQLNQKIEVFTFRRNYSRNVFLGKCKSLLNGILYKKTPYEREKEKKFKSFEEKIVFAPETLYRSRSNDNIAKKYDFFMAGSDQVWNPEYPITSAADFMTFAEENQRLSYSASIGVRDFENCQKEKYINWLKGVKHLSVREDTARDAIKNITGREAEIHIDPTLLLTKEEWIDVEKQPEWYCGESFVVVYFLGPIPEEAKAMISKEMRESKHRIIYMDLFTQGNDYAHGPSEFVWIIHHAERLYTDSFHGCVFSLIFDRPFVVFKRSGNENGTGSRVECLLKRFDLYENEQTSICVDGVDRKKFISVINNERMRTKSYLEMCLNLKIDC